MNINNRIQRLKDNPETSAVGSFWTFEEENILIKSISENKSIDDIAKEHKRTSGGISSRLRDIAVRMIKKEGKTIEDVCKTLRMSREEIENAQKRRDIMSKKNLNQDKKKPKAETELDLLTDIRNILLRMEAKLFKE